MKATYVLHASLPLAATSWGCTSVSVETVQFVAGRRSLCFFLCSVKKEPAPLAIERTERGEDQLWFWLIVLPFADIHKVDPPITADQEGRGPSGPEGIEAERMVHPVPFGDGPVGVDQNRKRKPMARHELLHLFRPLSNDPEGRGAHLLKGRKMLLQLS